MSRKVRRLLASAALLLALAPALSATAQECTIQTITGVYVYNGFGQSFVGGAPFPITTPPDPAHGILPLHAPGAYLNGTQLGVFIVHPDYSVDTLTWLAMGPYRNVPGTGLPATVTSIGWERTSGGDALACVATVEYYNPELGPGRDKFIVFDNGNEIRGVHALNGNPITTSIYNGKRITRALDAAPRCGAQTLAGSYVATCPRALLYNSDGTTMSIAAMLGLKTLPDGALEGRLFNRIETSATEASVHGAWTMGDNCIGDGELYGLLPGLPTAKAIFTLFAYDQGKGAFLFPTELELENGVRVPYPTTQSCTLERIGK